ncbi:hypothetical protein [Klebsiella phage vB_KpnS_Uniso31]|uniref:Uncharacterized protein n=1 Tax=Klebsiella phage vB_KpnS_Uniso31 TaxID=2951200 RepID=A0A9E7NFJ4_9CAUD|nr:hypothetical protein [Klebsiella phage vB_KpnS_Uniso31]
MIFECANSILFLCSGVMCISDNRFVMCKSDNCWKRRNA